MPFSLPFSREGFLLRRNNYFISLFAFALWAAAVGHRDSPSLIKWRSQGNSVCGNVCSNAKH